MQGQTRLVRNVQRQIIVEAVGADALYSIYQPSAGTKTLLSRGSIRFLLTSLVLEYILLHA